MNNEMKLNFDVSLDDIKILKTTSFSCLYSHGKIRYVRAQGEEVIRMIYTALRDANWNTAPYDITEENIEQKEDAFHVSYIANYHMNEIAYRAQISIHGEGNQLTYTMDGEALSDFKRNRIGICVLHSIPSIAGKDVEITRPSGEIYTREFPVTISPHQPVKDIRNMNWIAGVNSVVVDFEGDVFETEDQRNWSDSSFKTYSTPLDIPIPVSVKKGDRIHQEVKIAITRAKQPAPRVSPQRETIQPFPPIGYSKTPGKKLNKQHLEFLRQIVFDHYRVELDLTSNTWTEELQTAVAEARQVDTKLQLTCFFGDDVEPGLTNFLNSMTDIDHLVYSVLVVDKKTSRTNIATYPTIYERLKGQYPHVKTGYGTNNHFADLNRNLPKDVPFDFVSFGLTPQAHSTDTISLLENLDNQRDIIDTVKTHLGEVEIHVSPITFKGRKANLFAEGDTPADFDQRQHTEFGAAWVLMALQNFSGTHVTLFDACGYKGVIGDQISGDHLSPLFNLLQQLRTFMPDTIIEDDVPGAIILENHRRERFVIHLAEQFRSFRMNIDR